MDQAFADAWDEQVMLASRRSWWRIGARLHREDPMPVRRRGVQPVRVKPVLAADRAHAVWSWDITDLPSVYMRIAYKLYVVMDVFSRQIVGFRVEERESDQLAVGMFAEAISVHGIPGVVHADSGPSMRSNLLKDFLTTRGIEMSFIRPSVSNDNPFSESVFAMIKTRRDYPRVFTSLEHARRWAQTTIEAYNTGHHHSGLALFTPNEVADGSWRRTWETRQAVLDAYYAAHPERFHKPPVTPSPAVCVGINNTP